MAFVDCLSVALLQTDIIWGKRDINFQNYENLLNKLPEEVHLVLLPETFSTGFMCSADIISEQEESIVQSWMLHQSEKRHIALCGTAMISEQGKIFNRFYFVQPDGLIHTYDKRHLFGFGGENQLVTGGKERKIITWLGWKFLPQICYDIRFPVWIRNRWNDETGYEYDMILLSSNWPASRSNILNALIPARAIENQCFVAGVNRIGPDGVENPHNGLSQIVDFKGNILAIAEENQEDIIIANCSKSDLKQFRSKFPFGKDQDRFVIYD